MRLNLSTSSRAIESWQGFANCMHIAKPIKTRGLRSTLTVGLPEMTEFGDTMVCRERAHGLYEQAGGAGTSNQPRSRQGRRGEIAAAANKYLIAPEQRAALGDTQRRVKGPATPAEFVGFAS